MGHRVTTLNVNTIEPAGSTLTLGASGDTVVATDSVNVNTVKDAGGNTLWVSNGSGTLSSVNSGLGDSLKLISSQTADDDASVSFTSGIDSSYKEYIFKFYNIAPATQMVAVIIIQQLHLLHFGHTIMKTVLTLYLDIILQ